MARKASTEVTPLDCTLCSFRLKTQFGQFVTAASFLGLISVAANRCWQRQREKKRERERVEDDIEGCPQRPC